ncbi:YbaN family protein [Alkanindiges sp. WGS2144]|uniref:YbaN family protein n=1 Tax=Alkanindiges sp. WGS2144 TaxID=3366808 RepID=UPI00375297B1
MRILFWRGLVIIFLVLAFIGALLPGMPTTVFLILAAWAASKGWPALDLWLTNHPKYGKLIVEWRTNRTIPRRAKVIASLMMLGSGVLMLFTPAPFWVKVFTDGVMLSVAVWMWTRPEPKHTAPQITIVEPATKIKTTPAKQDLP